MSCHVLSCLISLGECMCQVARTQIVVISIKGLFQAQDGFAVIIILGVAVTQHAPTLHEHRHRHNLGRLFAATFNNNNNKYGTPHSTIANNPHSTIAIHHPTGPSRR